MNKGQQMYLEREAEREAERRRFVPAVRSGCICPNGHKADERGMVITSPSCIIHGPRSPHITRGDDGIAVVWTEWSTANESTHRSTEHSLAGAIADTARRIATIHQPERTLAMNSILPKASQQTEAPIPELTLPDPFPATIPVIDAERIAPTSGPAAPDGRFDKAQFSGKSFGEQCESVSRKPGE